MSQYSTNKIVKHMKKVQIQKIISLSSFIMTDLEYNKFINYITFAKFNSAILFLDKIMCKLHKKLEESLDIQNLISQYEKCNQLENIVFDLLLSEKQMNDKKTNTRRRMVVTG